MALEVPREATLCSLFYSTSVTFHLIDFSHSMEGGFPSSSVAECMVYPGGGFSTVSGEPFNRLRTEVCMEKGQEVVWITGASTGIGKALAQAYLQRGARVAVSSRTEETLRHAFQDFPEDQVLIAAADVTDRTALMAVVEQVRVRWGRVDTVIANAGNYWATPVASLCAADHEQMMAVNYGGLVNVAELVLPLFREVGKGHLALMASVVGYRGLPRSSAYGASKAAAIHFAESIRFELEREGVAVTVINPGFVKTPLTAQNEFQMPFLIESAEAARIIMRGMDRKAREIHFPWQFSWLLKVFRILPFPLYHWLIQKQVFGNEN